VTAATEARWLCRTHGPLGSHPRIFFHLSVRRKYYVAIGFFRATSSVDPDSHKEVRRLL
jgi:hypothetical protein